VASKHFSKLDRESQAVHESWDQIIRIMLVVLLLSIIIWAAVSGLRWAVHLLSETVLGAPDSGLSGWVVLIGVMASAELIRSWLCDRPDWADAAGDGMDVALRNYHLTYQDPVDNPQPRYDLPAFGLALRKGVATCLTLGSGASGGLEAPAVAISEALSAGCSRIMQVTSEFELRTYQIAGIAAAVATLLGAPFTAALFATEVAYGDRIIYRKLAYALWAGVIAYWLNNRLHGFAPLFQGPSHAPVYSLSEYMVAALVAVAVSVPLAFFFSWAMAQTNRVVGRFHPRRRAVVAATGAGFVALVLWASADIAPTQVLGMGEETINALLSGKLERSSAWVLALILVGKVLTTGLTITGRGSAGMLVPAMFLGGLSGALVAQLLNLSGWVSLDPALFTVVGIGSALVAVVGVPLSAIALVLEVFGKSFGPPAILACGVTYLVTLKLQIYRNQRMSPDPIADECG
jgi:CIC family chloride channel protein